MAQRKQDLKSAKMCIKLANLAYQEDNDVPLIYASNGRYYDLVYGWKDYEKETEIIERLITKFKVNNGDKLLDVGCGTGAHLKYMTRNYKCTGLDINSDLLAVASEKNKNIDFQTGDMINFKMDINFDVITCLFSSIGYVKTLENLEKTLKNLFIHLNVGGVLVIEPWFNKQSKSFKVNIPFLTTFEAKEVKIARLSMAKIKDDLSIMDTHYLVAENGGVVKHFSEEHVLGLFEKDDVLKIMKNVGFSPAFLAEGLNEEDRGLYIGTK